ncbi:MAG: hypothetical protein ACE37F_28480 [Nannocystaceae bacterium]|nr:hypothetical protein [bacterium]
MSLLGIVGAVLGMVGTVQGAAWLGGTAVGSRRRAQGAVLAPVGLAVVLVSLLHVLVPGFFGGEA